MAESDAPTDANRKLDRDIFELEKMKAGQDYELRQRELDLKARELDIKDAEVRTGKWRSPLMLAVVGAVLGGFSSIAVTYLDNSEKSRDARSKAQSDLIIESTKADRMTGRRNLLFFIKAGLMDDPEGKITKLINEDLYPSLPPSQALAQAQEKWVPSNGEAPNYPEALRLFRIAADKGDARAMANIGWIYENALGVPQDCGQAMEWYRKSLAAGGYPIANWNIGRLYDLGCGVKQDYHEARSWYEKAAANGVPNAFRDLKKLDQDGH